MKKKQNQPVFFWMLVLFVILTLVFSIGSCDTFIVDENNDSSDLGDNNDNGDENDNGDDNPDTLQPDQFETNNTWQTAHQIVLDTELNATLHENSDIDFYEITTAHGSDTYDNVQYYLGSGSAELLFRFELYNTSGVMLYYATADTSGQNFTNTISCPGGTYLFRVSGWNSVMDSDNGSHGAYSMKVSNLDDNDVQAPNHTSETAASAIFGTAYQGVIVSIYEDDWFTVTNSQSDRWDKFEVQITNVSSELAAGYYIYNADKEEIYGNNGANSAFTTGGDQFKSFASKSAGFNVMICGWNNVMHSPHGSKGSYTFTIVDQNANDTYEPDDTLAQAREITVTEAEPLSIDGTVLVEAANDNDGDYEWFKVNIPDNKKISWLADPADTNTELHFNVYEAEGTDIGGIDGDDGETISGFMTNSSGSASFFYIELGAFVGDTGNYNIEFTMTTP